MEGSAHLLNNSPSTARHGISEKNRRSCITSSAYWHQSDAKSMLIWTSGHRTLSRQLCKSNHNSCTNVRCSCQAACPAPLKTKATAASQVLKWCVQRNLHWYHCKDGMACGNYSSTSKLHWLPGSAVHICKQSLSSLTM